MPNDSSQLEISGQVRRIRRFICCGLLLCGGASGPLLSAQTTFQWPTAQVDVTKYASFEKCIAATTRAKDSVKAGLLADTLTVAQHGFLVPLPTIVVNVAATCLSHFSIDSIISTQYTLVEPVALVANQDSYMISLVKQHVAAGRDNHARAMAIDTAITFLLDAQPIRLRLADSLMDEIEQYGDGWNDGRRLEHYAVLARQAKYSDENSLFEKYADRYLSLLPSVLDTISNLQGRIYLQYPAMQFVRWKYQSVLLDSLGKSTASYVRLKQRLLEKHQLELSTGLLGTTAVPVFGDYWWPASSRGTVYPRAERLTLVVYMDCCDGGRRRPELDAFAALRRISGKFADLDIVIVTPTGGYFDVLQPPPPELEAELLYENVIQFYKVPAILAVSNRPFWKLKDPDRRRVNEPYGPDEFQQGYSALITKVGNNMYLIDEDKVLVEYWTAGRYSEADIIKTLDVLKKRNQQ